MDGRRIGRSVRALRHRLVWRQIDLAERAGVSQSLVSLVERGHIDAVAVGTLEAFLRALDADLVLLTRWRGGDLDRLLDEGHAAVLGATAELLQRQGWIVESEVTFAVYGERGSIDIVAWHPATATLLVVEVKTELVSIEATLRTLDVKTRLASRVVEERFGWTPRAVARLLVLPDASTPRRQVRRHHAVMARAFPVRGLATRSWLRAPTGPAGLLLFLPQSPTTGVRGRQRPVTRKRVRRPRGGTA